MGYRSNNIEDFENIGSLSLIEIHCFDKTEARGLFLEIIANSNRDKLRMYEEHSGLVDYLTDSEGFFTGETEEVACNNQNSEKVFADYRRILIEKESKGR